MCAASAATTKIYAWLYEHKTLGKDKEIGTGEIDVNAIFFFDTFELYSFAHNTLM
jgi:hypothetical protein